MKFSCIAAALLALTTGVAYAGVECPSPQRIAEVANIVDHIQTMTSVGPAGVVHVKPAADAFGWVKAVSTFSFGAAKNSWMLSADVRTQPSDPTDFDAEQAILLDRAHETIKNVSVLTQKTKINYLKSNVYLLGCGYQTVDGDDSEAPVMAWIFVDGNSTKAKLPGFLTSKK